jgi:hypothetical protein
MCARGEKENLNGEPKREEENVRQHNPAPPRRNLLKHPFNGTENQRSRGDHIGPQPAQRVPLDRWLKKLRYRWLRP